LSNNAVTTNALKTRNGESWFVKDGERIPQ
jgi:hypothetical protein